jgi:CBS domain-containing protein
MRRARKSNQPNPSVQAESCVAEVMGTRWFTLSPDTSASAALRLATDKHVSHFLVVQDGGLTGIVCDTDLQNAGSGKLVEDCMTSPVLCIGPETTVEEATGIMEENEVGCLPVVTGTFLVGMVTRVGLESVPRHNDNDLADLPLPPTKAAGGPLTCVSCGSHRRVARDVRSNLIPMCQTCLGGPAGDGRRKAN